MTDRRERPEGQDSIDALLATADRCYRLAAPITDRSKVERLLEMARECEERAAAIRRGRDAFAISSAAPSIGVGDSEPPQQPGTASCIWL